MRSPLSAAVSVAWAWVATSPAADPLHNTRGRAQSRGRASSPRLASTEAALHGEYDVAVVGAGIGGLCAAAVLTQVYGKRVAVCEAHYLAGGCAHAFERRGADGTPYLFDSGPTIVLGCSAPPYNPLRQVLNAVGQGEAVQWIRYDGWGMVVPPSEAPATLPAPGAWKLQLGPGHFQEGPLSMFGGAGAVGEFESLRVACAPLVTAAADIPAMAMRGGRWSLLPLLRHLEALKTLAAQGETATDSFGPFLDGPLFTVHDAWLRSWLDALAFSLSGLPAAETSAAAMAYVLFDMHREGAALDYPKGGMGSIVDALVAAIESGGSTVALRSPVARINTDGRRATGVTLASGRVLDTGGGVVCNAPVWSLGALVCGKGGGEARGGKVGAGVGGAAVPLSSEPVADDWPKGLGEEALALLRGSSQVEMTRSYLHLHLALDATGVDLSSMEAHYTVMTSGLLGPTELVISDQNMVAISNPCKLDPDLAPPGILLLHAYGCGNEPYERWEGMPRGGAEYERLKRERAEVLWQAVERVIPDARRRVKLELIGSPLTHEHFLRRPRGTYGATFASVLPDCATPIRNLVLCGDSVFPGIGVPAVAVNGASAANTLVGPIQHWRAMDKLTASGQM